VHADFGRELEAELRGVGEDLLLQREQELEGDVEEVAAAAGGVEDGGGGEFFLEGGQLVALGRLWCPCL
jgi:hypothetical protein